MGSIKLSEAARQNIRAANQKKFSRSLDDVVKDIRKERKARQGSLPGHSRIIAQNAGKPVFGHKEQ